MEVSDNSGTDVDKISTEAIPGKAYPIRLLHLHSGLMIIGYVIHVFPETTMVLRPYIIDIDFNSEKNEIDGYEFDPYLDQMIHNEPTDYQPVPFMNTSIISISRPAQHVLDNYKFIIRMKETLSNPNFENIRIFSTSNPSTKTKH